MKEETVTCEGCNKEALLCEAYHAEDGFWVCNDCIKEEYPQLKTVEKLIKQQELGKRNEHIKGLYMERCEGVGICYKCGEKIEKTERGGSDWVRIRIKCPKGCYKRKYSYNPQK